MITVWEYRIDETAASLDGWRVSIPRGGQIVQGIAQHAEPPCMWVLVDTNKPLEERLFRVYPTGAPVDRDAGGDLQHVGTCLIDNGHTVGHLFEVLQ